MPLLAAALEILHPTWSDESVYDALAGQVGPWLTVHLCLVVLFALLAVVLAGTVREAAPPTGVQRIALLTLALLGLCNCAYLALDGLGTGLLVMQASEVSGAAQAQALAAAQQFWTGSLTGALADLAGAAWALGLLACAAALHPLARTRTCLLGLALVFALFLAQIVVPGSGQVSQIVAIGVGAVLAYQGGTAAVPTGLLALAAVLPQHVGSDAELGLLCVFAALLGRQLGWGHEPG